MNERLASWFLPSGAGELQGLSLSLGGGLSVWTGMLLVLGIGLGAGAWVFQSLHAQPVPRRLGLAAMRGSAVGIAAFLLLDPLLTGYQIRPSGQTVAVLFDDSASMAIEHSGGKRRADLFLEAWERNDGELERRLGERFNIAAYGVAETAYRITRPGALRFDGRESHLWESVRSVVSELGPERLAGILLLTDGVEQGPGTERVFETDEAPGVPVYAAALPPTVWRDLEIGDLGVPPSKFSDVPVILDIPLQAEGLAGEKIIVERLEATREGEGAGWQVADSRALDIAQDAERHSVRFQLPADGETWASGLVRARIAGQAAEAIPRGPGAEAEAGRSGGGELIAGNNEAGYLVDLRPKPYDILFFSGRPNWENAFVRRAIAGDRQLAMTTHVRISDAEKRFVFRGRKSSMSNRLFEGFAGGEVEPPRYDEAVFLRFGPGVNPLAPGYPERVADLFRYDLVIWNDVEYAFFNSEQVKQTREFVRKRGGSLLLLGGSGGFAAAGFAGTIVEGMLPVLIPRDGESALETGRDPDADWTVAPTLEGELDGLMSLTGETEANRMLWREMPAVAGLNRFAATRPGATVLAKAASGADSEPLYVVHRYGEGRTAALATGTTWFWKMQREANDTSHERIWRQLLRDLVKDAPDPVRLNGRREVYAQGGAHALEFNIRDAEFEPRESLQIEVIVTAPSGQTEALPVEESLERPGIYAALWRPEEIGDHAIRLAARTTDGELIGELEDRLLVQPDRRELTEAKPDLEYLAKLAKASGGELLPLDSLGDVVEKLPWSPPDERELLRIRIWHLPVFYVLLTGLLCGEWILRRRRGLA